MFAAGMDDKIVKVDYSELEKFLDEMKITSQEFNNFLKDLLLQIGLRIIALTKKKQAGKIDPKYTAFDTGQMTASWGIAGRIFTSGRDICIELVNGVEYATEIEYGHRIIYNGVEIGYYNGRFMLKTSIDEISSKIPEYYNAEFKKFCRLRGLDVN